LTLEGGFIKARGLNPETRTCSRQGDKRAARNKRRCERRPSTAAKMWLWPRFCRGIGVVAPVF